MNAESASRMHSSASTASLSFLRLATLAAQSATTRRDGSVRRPGLTPPDSELHCSSTTKKDSLSVECFLDHFGRESILEQMSIASNNNYDQTAKSTARRFKIATAIVSTAPLDMHGSRSSMTEAVKAADAPISTVRATLLPRG